MAYPDPLKVVSRKITENIVLSSSGFRRFDKINFGARMALFNYNGSIVVWSALPYGDGVKKALEMTSGSESPSVSYVIVPDKEHTMAAKSFKQEFPQLKIIAMEGVDLGSEAPVDHVITEKYKDVLLDSKKLQEIGIKDSVILDNFEFVYLPEHTNKELVMYDKNSKSLFQADLFFNLRSDDKNEQFSKDSGFPEGASVFTGFSYPAKYMNPDSKVGRFLMNKAANSSAAAEGIKNIYKWDFDRLVMCHGSVFETGGKEAFHKVFEKVLKK
ncbi:hypothetical protein FT663_02193 [Candidozyma haemuli var. vulneris]|uniref:Metallo-beta-lactamase domain-containing protein n=1 Tax=Candidozyma haemuli TaxID=45357 RepID=A0A2V1AW75_9ASCO|nr:hypothetical protein CXQ85_004721 [[Candida] haemuloni]KAF3990182.1 hypothetical protein FT662_02392 [[Candida] haemuloni var. vulneris]KAF3992680.1 hypothetical protein FT663_02193 [[Candida] haemuloni var. vulneris]PVH22052.1 hypothetical protein CXQ85_004721 [[Candida] haemuloni]